MIKVLIIGIAVICNICFLVIPIVLPFLYVKKTGKFLRGFFQCWFLSFLLSFVMTIFVPSILLSSFPNQKGQILNSFPEAIVNTPVILLGWIQALIVCGIAYRSHIHYIERLQGRKQIDNNVT
ncbi:MAG: hypothetical protein ACYSUH_07860 [Planctomycetota bacterium]|jgi:hypothetical protein